MSKVWFVKLPPSWHAVFQEIAENEGDKGRGSAARQVRRALTEYLKMMGKWNEVEENE